MILTDCDICEEQIQRSHSGEPWSHADLALNAQHNPVERKKIGWGPKRFADHRLTDMIDETTREFCQGMKRKDWAQFQATAIERLLENAREELRFSSEPMRENETVVF